MLGYYVYQGSRPEVAPEVAQRTLRAWANYELKNLRAREEYARIGHTIDERYGHGIPTGPVPSKTCSACEEDKPLGSFAREGVHGRQPECRACAWRARHTATDGGAARLMVQQRARRVRLGLSA